MNKKRLAKAFALSAALSLSTVAAISLAGCNNEEKHTHELTEVTAVEATCTTDGHIAYWTCSGCDLIFADASGAEETTLADTVRSKLGHELGDEHHHAADPATCTEPGTREYWECGRCELKFSDAEGKNQITDVVTTKDHSLSEGYHEMVFPTTDATGTREYWQCEECDGIFSDRYGDNETTLAALAIDRVSENIDGTLTGAFYNTENVLAVGGADVKDGGAGFVVNAMRASDGLYLHIVANYNVAAKDQPAERGKIGLYFNVRNTDNYNLPGGAVESLQDSMLMELYLNGNIEYHKPYLLLKNVDKTNEDGAKTKYTKTWELFIPHSGFATVNNGVFAEAFEQKSGKTVLKPGYSFLMTAVGSMAAGDTFTPANGSKCEVKDNDTWSFWFNENHGDWAADQKYYAVGDTGVTTEFTRATDTYKVNVSQFEHAAATGLNETVDCEGTLQGKVTVDAGYRLSGFKVNGKVFTFDKNENDNTYDYSISVAELGLKWNVTDIDIDVVVTKLDYADVAFTLQSRSAGEETPMPSGKRVTLASEFGDSYESAVGADGSVTFENVLCLPYSVKIDGYFDGNVNVVLGAAGDDVEVTLVKIFAYTHGTAKLDDMNTLKITGVGCPPDGTPWSGYAEIVTDKTSGDKSFEFTVKDTNVRNGGFDFAARRIAVQIAGNNGFFFWFNSDSEVCVRKLKAENVGASGSGQGGAYEGELISSNQGWLKGKVEGDGLKLRVTRIGTRITLNAFNGAEWVRIGETACTANDSTEFALYAQGDDYEFSNIASKALEHVAAVAPSESNGYVGNIEHYTDGTNYYLADGSVSTLSDVTIKEVNVTLSVTAKELDGTTPVTIADGTTIELSGRYRDYTFTVGTPIEKMIADTYEAYLYGYGKVNVTVSNSGGNIELALVKTFAYTDVSGNNGEIAVDAENKTVTIKGNGTYASWMKTEIVLSDEIKGSKNVSLTFTVKDAKESTVQDAWAARRFGVTMQGANGGFMCFTPGSNEAKLYTMGATPGAEDIALVYNDLASLLRSESGAEMRVVREDGKVSVFVKSGSDWSLIKEYGCGANDDTKITLYGVGDEWVFSNIAVTEYTATAADAA